MLVQVHEALWWHERINASAVCGSQLKHTSLRWWQNTDSSFTDLFHYVSTSDHYLQAVNTTLTAGVMCLLTWQEGLTALVLHKCEYRSDHTAAPHYEILLFSTLYISLSRYSWTQYFTVNSGLNILISIMLQCKHSYFDIMLFYIIERKKKKQCIRHLELFRDLAMKGRIIAVFQYFSADFTTF